MKGTDLRKRLQLGLRKVETLERVPFVAGANLRGGPIAVHLGGRQQPGVIVLVAGERQAEALDRIGDEDGRAVMVDRLERFDQARQVMPAEIGHQTREFVVAALVDQPRHGPLIAEIVEQALAPGRAALEGEGGVKLVGAGVDPLPQPLAAGLREGFPHQRAVLQHDHVPAEGAEDRFEAVEQPLAHHRVEALAVVVDDPPRVAKALFPALQQGLEDVALVHLRIAEKRDHASLGKVGRPIMGFHIILNEAREEGLRHAQADRTGGKIHVVDVLGAGRIGLRALVAAEIFELLAGLMAQQILDGVKDRARMGLDRHPILRPQDGQVQSRHDGRKRGRGRLMAADLHAVGVGAHMIGVVDRPAGEPANLLFERGEIRQARVGHRQCPG